jgi:hypothetical protein
VDRLEIIAAIDAEIERLEDARLLIARLPLRNHQMSAAKGALELQR